MLSSIPYPLSLGEATVDQAPERRKRTTEAVYAFCVLATGLLLLITAV